MTDSLTASLKWCRYDYDFKEKNGFRLPAGKAYSGFHLFCLRHLSKLQDISHPPILHPIPLLFRSFPIDGNTDYEID